MTRASPDRRAGGVLPPPDFSVRPVEDLRDCPWWRPVRVGVLPGDGEDPVLASFLPQLVEAFRAHGHAVDTVPCPQPDILLSTASIPEGEGALRDRVEEREKPLLLTPPGALGLESRPPHIVTLVGLGETIAHTGHREAVDLGRVTMARLGSPKVVFVGGDRLTGTVREATVCTMEGGHPTDTVDLAQRVRDRLVSAACAREVGGQYEFVEGGIPEEAWQGTAVPDALVKAGRRMDELGLLPPPEQVGSYVSDRVGALYERLLGLKGFSEGMLFAYDPGTATMMVTASGSWDVDKRALRREEVVPVDARSGELPVRVLVPPGASVKGPSVEAYEMLTLLLAVPRIRLGRGPSGAWRPDPDGEVEAPIVRAGIHAHVGIDGTDPSRVESLPANRQRFPYGFGCGTDLMHAVVEDMAARSEAMNDPADPRAVARWPMLYHGDTLVELWRPGLPEQPLEGLLNCFADGGITCTPEHIEQPV